jgi:hypothetical protein
MNAAAVSAVKLDIQENTIAITTKFVTGNIAVDALRYIEQQSGNRILMVEMLLEASRLPGDRILGVGVYLITHVKIRFRHEFDDEAQNDLISSIRAAFGAITDFEMRFVDPEDVLTIAEFNVVECREIVTGAFVVAAVPNGLVCAKMHPSRCGAAFTQLGEGIAAVLAQQIGKDVGTIVPVHYQLDRVQNGRFDVRITFNDVPADADVNAFDAVLDVFDAAREQEGACVFTGNTLRVRGMNVLDALLVWM